MFSRILIEKEVLQYPKTQEILKRFKDIPTKLISEVDDVFGRVKKPYAQV